MIVMPSLLLICLILVKYLFILLELQMIRMLRLNPLIYGKRKRKLSLRYVLSVLKFDF